MTGFDFVLVLLSFVYALAMGHVLTSAGRLLMCRERVVFSGLLALAMANAVLQVYVNWLGMWDFRELERWDLPEITLFFLVSVITYLMCVVVSPEPEFPVAEGGRIDLGRVFLRNRRWFYAFYLALLAAFMVMSVSYLETPTPELALPVAVWNAPYVAIGLLGLLVARPWAQWTAGIAMFAMGVYWLVRFAPALD